MVKRDKFTSYIKLTSIGAEVYTLKTEENKDIFKTNGTTDFTKEYTYVNDELSKTYTAGITTTYGYNSESLVSVLENTLNALSQVYGYGYDKNGNITTETLTTTSKDENGATIETNEAIHYTYDDKEQLISAETSSIKYEYTYDDRGNILTKKEYSISLDENNEKVYTLIEANTDTYVCDDVSYIGITELELSYNPFTYCENNAVSKYDEYGTTSRSLLNKLFKNYRSGLFLLCELFAALALLNSGNPYNAFHELTQIIVATQLFNTGRYLVELERHCQLNKRKEIDIWAYRDQRRGGINYIWEVKPYKQSSAANKQINEYLKINKGYVRGFKNETIRRTIIDALNKIGVKVKWVK